MFIVFLNTVTDDQLQATVIISLLALCILLAGIALNFWWMVKARNRKRGLLRAALALIFLIPVPIVWHRYLLERALLYDARYTEGVTQGYCEEFAKGKGILFMYEIRGKKYRACNTPHPVPINQLVVPGGHYPVRYCPQFPENGRMMFDEAEP